MSNSVLAPWMGDLKLQQQSVLLLALRGPDGDPKHTAFKPLLRPYRGTVLKAAKFNRMLELHEKADSFMSMEIFGSMKLWEIAVGTFLEDAADASVLHHYTHFMHGAEILAYKHPDPEFRKRWLYCYEAFVYRLHLNVETPSQMDARLSDWGGRYFTN